MKDTTKLHISVSFKAQLISNLDSIVKLSTGSVCENPSVNSCRERLDHQTETLMDRLTEEDSVGEFAEVEQPFRQYLPSQTDLPAFSPCQQTHLPSSMGWLMRILCFLNIFCLCVCTSVNSSSVPVMTMELAQGHACVRTGGLWGWPYQSQTATVHLAGDGSDFLFSFLCIVQIMPRHTFTYTLTDTRAIFAGSFHERLN